jgi:hypothetical protein
VSPVDLGDPPHKLGVTYQSFGALWERLTRVPPCPPLQSGQAAWSSSRVGKEVHPCKVNNQFELPRSRL